MMLRTKEFPYFAIGSALSVGGYLSRVKKSGR